MSISNVSELRTAVSNWLDRTDISDDRINEFITLAEARIGRRLRSKGNERRSTTPLVPGQEYYTLPSSLEIRNVQINTNPVNVLRYRTPQQIDYEYPNSATGTPKVFTVIGTEIQLKPIPDSTDNMEVAYFYKLPALTDAATTNWLTANAPDLLLYGALIEAEAYLVDDPRIAVWKAAFDTSMAEWNRQDAKGRHSGSALQIRANQ